MVLGQMKNKNALINIMKTIIPSGVLIALVWQFLQVLFFINSWAQPGTTSWSLFFIQVTFVSVLLFFSFQFYQNQINDRKISFGKCLQLGFLTGIFVAIFGILFFLVYTNYINPTYEVWLQEMYWQSWTARGLSESEIQKQIATNDWLKTTNGIIYSFFFVIGLMTLFSIIPALLVLKFNSKNQAKTFA